MWVLIALLLAAVLGPSLFGWKLIAAYTSIPTVPARIVRDVTLARPGVAPLTGGQGVAVSVQGAIFVADPSGGRVLVFWDGTSESGTVFAPRPGQPPLSQPVGIALAGDGTIYVLDSRTGSVHAYDERGALLRLESWASHGARALAVDAKGNVYIADTGAHVIRKFLPSGQPDVTWGGDPGGGMRRLGPVFGIATVGDDLYAVTHKALVRLGPAGQVLSTHSLLGNAGMLAAAPDGTLYMSDIATNRVWILDGDGATAGRVVGPRGEENTFGQPRGLAVTGPHLYVVNTNRVTLYQLGG